VEFAYIIPIMTLLIGAIIMIAFAMFTRSNLQQGVREAARQAAVGNLAEAADIGSGNAADSVDPEEIKLCLPTGSSGSVGDEIRAYIDEGNDGSEGYGFTLIPATGVFAAFGWTGLTVDMAPRATARLERSVSGVSACT
jgi:hypothetical protein